MKCIIIDDDEITRSVIEDYVKRTSFLTLAEVFSGAVEAINYINEGNTVDLIFLDIEMPEMTGIEFLDTITQKPEVIIVSSREKYALEAFEYNVIDYLLKPATYARFFKAANKALENFDKNKQDSSVDEIFVKKGNSLVKVKYSHILWIEALENYVVINSLTDKFTIHFTMKAIENQLPTPQFKRVHRSFIVNLKAISSIEDNSVVIKLADGRKVIPIGKSYRDQLLNDINLINK
ncbi:MAG: LytTR family DNA-binding domain-containing protein [Bacteroidales bacterium]|nr:LytTR family DNA-binding domain-containing protein [Tenuifilaceae bacterium]